MIRIEVTVNKFVCIVLGAVLLLVCLDFYFRHFTEQYMHSSDGPKLSAKSGLLVKEVKVVPDHFNWRGHNVQIAHSWIERGKDSNKNQLVITLSVDNNPYGEASCLTNENKGIGFRVREGKNGLGGYSVCCPLISRSEIWQELITQKVSHRFSHFYTFEQSLPDEVQLTVLEEDLPSNLEKRLTEIGPTLEVALK